MLLSWMLVEKRGLQGMSWKILLWIGMLQKVKMSVDFGSEDIFRQGRLNELSTARQLFATIGHCYYQFSCTDIAKYLKITTSAVSMMISRSNRITELNYLKEMICN